MIAVSGDTMLIAFRGSKWIKDYLIDAEFFQRSSNVNEVRGKVHSGILRHYKNLRPALVNGIESRRHKVKKIFVTGHSLGGGLAQLTSLYIAKNKLPIKGLYTSAAPRLGDAEYLRDLEIHLQEKIYSAITQLDLVPHLPPSQWLAPEFAAIVPGDNVFTRWLKGFVEFLNYDVSPGQVTFIPQSGSWKTMKSFEKLSSERQYWERLKDSIQSGNIWQLFSDLQERFGTHTPEAYLCQLAEAESTKRSSLF
ncbi:lipase family protein [Pseudobacteriovorax antillogorgiicola]|uniref:Lipase (Class 3) n=1 Tax=Pseudobacteriovorax antillogorgiicola TaxID=1513793 RepID=A0A1Y6CNQ0_9BACT|nr:lipase family protein [Pseudobacteriovorax antillogorgiicola]TCS44574.1 lipase (class 3) [Pseudobacteriovorax antillogorgiicola]SMF77976.1 Lipase (class 3) [Pseudobacteriovorax antillogorgiicola]